MSAFAGDPRRDIVPGMRSTLLLLLVPLLACSRGSESSEQRAAAKTEPSADEASKAIRPAERSASLTVEQATPEPDAAPGHVCPCCGFPTLPSRGLYEICQLCLWEDDPSYDPAHPEAEVQGANGAYTLARARANFAEHLTMYDPSDERSRESERTKQTKRALMAAYEALDEASPEERRTLMQQIATHNQTLLEEVLASMK